MPTVRISPLTEAQYFDNNGDPLSGGKLFFYQGGSFSVQKTTYSDSAGTIPNANPIVLDSSGRPTVSAFMVVDELYNVQLTLADGTTVLNSWANIQVSMTGGGGGGGGGGTPALPNNSIQYNNSGAFGGSSTLTYVPTTQTISVGDSVTNVTTFAGTTATIAVSQSTRDITLLPGASGAYVVVGSTAEDGSIEGTVGQDLYLTSDQFLYLESVNQDVIMSLGANTSSKVSVQGPTAQQYATGLSDNDLVNKYYVDTAGGGGGGGGGASVLTPVLTSVNYTTVLTDNQKMIVLDLPTNPTTTITIDNSLAYAVGTTITFYNNSNQTMLIALSSGSMIQVQTNAGGTRTLHDYGLATVIKVKPFLWIINGSGLT